MLVSYILSRSWHVRRIGVIALRTRPLSRLAVQGRLMVTRLWAGVKAGPGPWSTEGTRGGWQIYWQADRRLDSAPSANVVCCCHGNKGRPYKILHGCIESAIPENPLEGRNRCGLSAVQVELWAILAQISLPWQQGSAPQHFVWFHWIGDTQKPRSRPKHRAYKPYKPTYISDFVPNFPE